MLQCATPLERSASVGREGPPVSAAGRYSTCCAKVGPAMHSVSDSTSLGLLRGLLAGGALALALVLTFLAGAEPMLVLGQLVWVLGVLMMLIHGTWSLLEGLRSKRTWASTRASIAMCASFITAAALGISVLGRLHTAMLGEVPTRLAPLIDAIERHTRERGSPPPTLQALLPHYIASLPDPGLHSAERIEYVAASAYNGATSWQLRLNASLGLSAMVLVYPPQSAAAAWPESRVADHNGWSLVYFD